MNGAGADVIVCPNNTLHRAFDWVVSPIPWLHIAAVVAAEAARRDFRRIGLIGMQVVMEGPIFLPQLRRRQIEPVLPDERDRGRLQHMIRTELIGGLAERDAEAVILACTELPLLLGNEDTAVPVLDSTTLLATAALQRVSTASGAHETTAHVSP